MPSSQNGYPVLSPDETQVWTIPFKGTDLEIRLTPGPAGFALAHYLLFFGERVEPLVQKQLDDWGYAVRNIRDSSEISNHASATAADLNATQHPLGVRGTFDKEQVRIIHVRLAWMEGILRWGGDYIHRADEMHVEVIKHMPDVARIVKKLQRTKRGIRIMNANPHYEKI